MPVGPSLTRIGYLSPISIGPMSLDEPSQRERYMLPSIGCRSRGRECQMGRPIVFAAPSLAVFAFLAGTPGAIGQATKTDRERLVGSWTEVSITAGGSGSQAQPFGPSPNGMLMVDAGGHISLTTLRSDLPKFQSNNRITGTADENKAIVQGSIAYFGTYVVDEATHEITIT